EGVDHHLAVDRARDLDAAVLEIAGSSRNPPAVVLTDLPRLGQKIRELAGVDLRLALGPPAEELLPARIELAVQVGDERQRLLGQDLLAPLGGAAANLDRHGESVRQLGASA